MLHPMVKLLHEFVLKQNVIQDRQVLWYVDIESTNIKDVNVCICLKIQFVTREGRPGPVTSLRGVPFGGNGIYLFWESPDEPNGYIIGYQIDFKTIER